MYLPVKNIKIFCLTCKGREAFRPILFSDVTNELLVKNKQQRSLDAETFKVRFKDNFQLFTMVYQCQRCEIVPNAFLLKRLGVDLYLEGRSPIENVELPPFIPKDEQKWFRDSVIAFQSGKILAAQFYLRTFMEQFARRKTNKITDKITGEELFAAYAETIPPNLRETMPSLGALYDKVSAEMHTAKEDASVFESIRKDIEEHFDIRRVHKLDQMKGAEELVDIATEESNIKPE